MGCIGGKTVISPLQATGHPAPEPPLQQDRIGHIASLASGPRNCLADVGINMEGNTSANHWRITPMGVAKPAWLTLSDHLLIDNPDSLPAKRVALMCIRGFLIRPNGMLAQACVIWV